MKMVLTTAIICSCLVLSMQASEKTNLHQTEVTPPISPAVKAAMVKSILKAPAKPVAKGPMVNLNDDSLPNNHKRAFNEKTGKYEIVDTNDEPLWTRFG